MNVGAFFAILILLCAVWLHAWWWAWDRWVDPFIARRIAAAERRLSVERKEQR